MLFIVCVVCDYIKVDSCVIKRIEMVRLNESFGFLVFFYWFLMGYNNMSRDFVWEKDVNM